MAVLFFAYLFSNITNLENTFIRNIALFAHVDAGKTTITEQFLFHSDKIKVAGSVDKGNTQTDYLEVEKERGITVNATMLSFRWIETHINLIDTPGHIDFGAEVEKAILAIDGAIVVVSAVEGVQAQTEHIVTLLKKYKIPFLIFINKIDRAGADIHATVAEIQKEFKLSTIELQQVISQASDGVEVTNLWTQEDYLLNTALVEQIVEQDEKLMNRYLDGEQLPWQSFNESLKHGVKSLSLIPVLVGSAKYGMGITYLLNSISMLLPPPEVLPDEIFGVVFKTRHEKGVGKVSAVRLFGGTIYSRTDLYIATKKLTEKVTLIKDADLQNQKVLQHFYAGEVAWVQGLQSVEPGDYLGHLPENHRAEIKTPALLTVQVILDNNADLAALIEALNILNNENPDLHFRFLKEEQELHLNIRGEVQKEILQSVLRTQFNIAVDFSKPTVIYKETPTIAGEGFVRYWMPKPCWAIMRFRIEPGERGSGVRYSSVVSVNDIKKQYQNDVAKAIPGALKQGILGWEVDDVKITLVEGEDHVAHTRSNDFTIATPMGIMDGLSKCKPTLLEPILSFKIIAPEAFLGAIISELLRLRAEFNNPEIDDGVCKVMGEIPVATSLDLPIKFSAMTGGKGKLLTRFSCYKTCDVSLGQTRPYKGISPLDTAKYILKARKALG